MKRVHLIGIGGTGLSAIALVLLESGIEVSGSDRQISPAINRLEAAGARITIGHFPENVHGADLVLRSSAVADDNIEVIEARRLGIRVVKRMDFLGQLTADKATIAVAGTHGKTTTTAMIAWILAKMGLDPTYIIGSVSNNLGTNAHAGKGAYFVIEADEYDRMFLGLSPSIAVVTNIEHDHPDCYPTAGDFYQAFSDFADRLPNSGCLVVCADDPGAARLAEEKLSNYLVRTYAIGEKQSDYTASELISNQRGGFDFELIYRPRLAEGTSGGQQKTRKLKMSLQAPGKHNVQNSLAALAVADHLGLTLNEAAKALENFSGTGRRFELRGEVAGVIIIDDYAHHPTEIQATLAAARARYPLNDLWVVWQPHTYSRTRSLAQDFAAAFGNNVNGQVNHVIVTEIYAAREAKPEDGFSSKDVVDQIVHPDVRLIPGLIGVSDYLLGHLHAGDVLIVLSAGDADQVSQTVWEGLRRRGSRGILDRQKVER